MTQRNDKAFKHARSLPIVVRIISQLKQQLPQQLCYHSVQHTIEVIEGALDLAIAAGVSGRDLELLAIAAAFHDSGFIEGRRDHELTSARLAAAAMRANGGYDKIEIGQVKTMILDTRLIENQVGVRQHPSSELGCYLLDADLANMGRADFFEKLELHRQENGSNQPLALRQALEIIENHRWHTDIAALRFQSKKEENIVKLKAKLKEYDQVKRPHLKELSPNRLKYLAQLPLLLNSPLHLRQVIALTLDHIKRELKAEAASILLLDQAGERLTFWALKGGAAQQLENKQMLSDKGIAGWVIANQTPTLVQDAQNDPRFYQAIDQDLSFTTKNMLCVPLTARRHTPLGAIQVINSTNATGFSEEDLHFLEQFGCQSALAIENVHLREALQARSSRLEELAQRKDQLIDLIGNSLLSPIDQILKTCHEMAAPTNSPHNPLLSQLRNSCEQVEGLIKRIRLLAQLDSNDVLPNRQAIQIAALIDRLHEEFTPIAKKKGVTLRSDVSTKTGEISVDPELMLIALGNLIQNALEATVAGGSVSVHASITGELVHIEVVDTGVGICSSEIPLLFDKFYQTQVISKIDQKNLLTSERLGIGLPIAQGIIRAHGSVLEVNSSPEKGSTFFFALNTIKTTKRE